MLHFSIFMNFKLFDEEIIFFILVLDQVLDGL